MKLLQGLEDLLQLFMDSIATNVRAMKSDSINYRLLAWDVSPHYNKIVTNYIQLYLIVFFLNIMYCKNTIFYNVINKLMLSVIIN